MPIEFEMTEPFLSEIMALRRQVAELRGIEQRCRQAEAALRAMEKRNQILGDSAPVGICTIDMQGSITGINRRMREMLSQSSTDDPISKRLSDYQALTASRIEDDIQCCIEQKALVTAEHSYPDSQGAPAHLRYCLSPISGAGGEISDIMVIVEDLTDLKRTENALRERERRLRDQALRDDLTGLYNRRYLFQSLAELVKDAKTTDAPVSLIFMDLDNFKQVVDTHGHLNGSRAIREVGRTIDHCLQAPSYAVAYAGDEFVVILPGQDQDQAFQKASEIRSRIKDTVYALDHGIKVRLQASFGVATFPQHAENFNALIAAADQALFSIKEAGKDAISISPPKGVSPKVSWG